MSEQFAVQTEVDEFQRDSFIERLMRDAAGFFSIYSIYIGDRLGYYEALSRNGSLNSEELARHTCTQERYTREWLEQQAVTGILEVSNAEAEPKARRFSLPAAHAEILVDKDSLNYLAPLAQLLAGVARPLPALLRAYRHGGGVSFSEYGEDVREGQAGMNRAMFLQELGQVWFPAIPSIHARLQHDSPAKVADIGCGAGWSAIAMASTYPKIHVDGFDLDNPSIDMARANARQANLNGRVTFHARDAADPALTGQYDLVTAFECVHDMTDPVGVLRTMRRLVNGSGEVIIVDERVGDAFSPAGNDVEWMMYGWSMLHCLPVGMDGQTPAGTGTVMRTNTLRGYAQHAGFQDVQVLPIENFFFRFYRLIP